MSVFDQVLCKKFPKLTCHLEMNGRKQKGFKKDGESDLPLLHSVQKKWVTKVRTKDKKKQNIRKKEDTKISKKKAKGCRLKYFTLKISEWEKAQ